MAFAPFDGILLEDPRDPISGLLALQYHHQVEQHLAAQRHRPPLGVQAIRTRASACQKLLAQGLLPTQLRELAKWGLALGSPQDVSSLAALLDHLEAYLTKVKASDHVEPMVALWEAAQALENPDPALPPPVIIERQEADGPLRVGLRDLAPPRLRLLCALTTLQVVFDLPTAKGQGICALQDYTGPHLIRQVLPTLESASDTLDLSHLALETPEGWAENPWGNALDYLFQGPLPLDELARKHLQRAELPTHSAVWRAAGEQLAAWLHQGIAPANITVVHPQPVLLGPWLQAMGFSLASHAGGPLKDHPQWAPFWTFYQALRTQDPVLLAGAFRAAQPDQHAKAWLALAHALESLSESGPQALAQGFQQAGPLPENVQSTWRYLMGAQGRQQMPSGWLGELEKTWLTFRWMDNQAFYGVMQILRDTWPDQGASWPFEEFLAHWESALEALQAPESQGAPTGIHVMAPEQLLQDTWKGCEAALMLDLGEGVWPQSPSPNRDLDTDRQQAINRALRAHRQQAKGTALGGFPAHLQCFLLPRCEESEHIPRAFHWDAYGFNRLLALTRRHGVALSAARDEAGIPRAQSAFWRALEGAGTWCPDPHQAHSAWRWHWEGEAPSPLALSRQSAMIEMSLEVPEPDLTPEVWLLGQDEAHPASPTLLEALAKCPFRARAEKHWRLDPWDRGDAYVLHRGTLAHQLLEMLLSDLGAAPHWPVAFCEKWHLPLRPAPADVRKILSQLWQTHKSDWMASLKDVNLSRLAQETENLCGPLAHMVCGDLANAGPTKEEAAALSLAPEVIDAPWQRQIVGLEVELPPLALPLDTPLWVRGKIDRLERLAYHGHAFLRIMDYKHSSYQRLQAYGKDDSPYTTHCQLPIYQHMVSALYGLPTTALLVPMREAWQPVSMTRTPEEMATLVESLTERWVLTQAGYFPPTPGEACSQCTLSALCGRPVDVDLLEAAQEESAP